MSSSENHKLLTSSLVNKRELFSPRRREITKFLCPKFTKQFLFIIFYFYLFSSTSFGQATIVQISVKQFDEQQKIALADLEGWLFREGNQTNWEEQDINLAEWQPLKPTQLNQANVADNGLIEGWFMLKIQLASDLATIPLSINRTLWAATDIYLDGILVHQFGQVNEFKPYNPILKPLSLSPIQLQSNKIHTIIIHFVNKEHWITPRDLQIKEKNLKNLIHLTGPDYLKIVDNKIKSTYIYQTLWVTVSIIFMFLFWLMYLQNEQTSIDFLIALLATINFLFVLSVCLPNIFELSLFQYKFCYFTYAFTGPLISILNLMIAEWMLKAKISIISKILLIGLPTTSFIAHAFNISPPYGIFHTTLTIYFFYLIYRYWKTLTKAQWAVLLGMIITSLFVTAYVSLHKFSLNTFYLYEYPLLTVIVLAPLVFLLLYVSMSFKAINLERAKAQREKTDQLQAINVASAKFVPTTFLNFLGKKNILEAKLGDHVEKQVTVLFSDIRAYTGLSEKMTPEENFRFVNAFNQRMGPIIRQYEGFVNQYLGDGIMAIFPEQAVQTVQAAINMQRMLTEYNQHRILKQKTPIRLGIGLHTGPLIMGIIGDAERFDAATISDTVNIAARLESLTKYFGVNILISEDSFQKLTNPEKFLYRYLGKVIVMGKIQPIGIYEFFDGDTAEQLSFKKQTLNLFQAGLKQYFNQDFTQASTTFQSILAINPADTPASLFLKKTRHHLTNSVSKEWTGVIVMDKK